MKKKKKTPQLKQKPMEVKLSLLNRYMERFNKCKFETVIPNYRPERRAGISVSFITQHCAGDRVVLHIELLCESVSSHHPRGLL